MPRSLTPPFFAALEDSRRILIAGMGGGFDVFCGLPLYFALRAEGRDVTLANLSFSTFSPLTPRPLAPALIEVTPRTPVRPGEYFPEAYLSRWLAMQGEPSSVYATEKTGVQPALAAYRALTDHLHIDTVILIDGGTDALMRGDEPDLGTPHEDAVSLCAVNELTGLRRFMVSLGFGIDSFHGVSHWNVLEATAELARAGAYLGSFSLTPELPPVQQYRDACEAVFGQMPRHTSIVNSSILSAIHGQYGDHHASERTHGSPLWINPLMAQYWCYELTAVARRLQYREALMDTVTMTDVDRVIGAHRASVAVRPRHTLPI
ncbi:DUF1152 domain-containing protein [Deinococcus aquiradiocola]|uniref:DUF1152 domain-containing protein n=1 Tax=Deinococcus aquiradiocola TaxID=393059 RepID=A0A917PHQ7_9DEIO|nr:DUF1152 domain-containing protein [Deinococcus aquiradiocola]GGJ79455.1 hypothetical protein GCM10008939_24110 [Deinococcus aquiradiocola]